MEARWENLKTFEWKNIQINFQTAFQQASVKLLNMLIALLKEEWCLFSNHFNYTEIFQ